MPPLVYDTTRLTKSVGPALLNLFCVPAEGLSSRQNAKGVMCGSHQGCGQRTDTAQ